jgi:hypothetical protein
MATPFDVIKKYSTKNSAEQDLIAKAYAQKEIRATRSISIKKIDAEKRIVYGEVYAPEIVDAHGHVMNAEEVEKLAHRFLLEAKNSHIDIMHNNKPALASAVESFIARKGDPTFQEGSWVLATKIFDDDLWLEIKSGKYSGYSMEVLVEKSTEVVKMKIQEHVFGVTEDNDGHNHVYYVKLNDDGMIVAGKTSKDAGHSHEIKLSTATEKDDNHTHRFFLP